MATHSNMLAWKTQATLSKESQRMGSLTFTFFLLYLLHLRKKKKKCKSFPLRDLLFDSALLCGWCTISFLIIFPRYFRLSMLMPSPLATKDLNFVCSKELHEMKVMSILGNYYPNLISHKLSLILVWNNWKIRQNLLLQILPKEKLKSKTNLKSNKQ